MSEVLLLLQTQLCDSWSLRTDHARRFGASNVRQGRVGLTLNSTAAPCRDVAVLVTSKRCERRSRWLRFGRAKRQVFESAPYLRNRLRGHT
jgi:hypothetical protein